MTMDTSAANGNHSHSYDSALVAGAAAGAIAPAAPHAILPIKANAINTTPAIAVMPPPTPPLIVPKMATKIRNTPDQNTVCMISPRTSSLQSDNILYYAIYVLSR